MLENIREFLHELELNMGGNSSPSWRTWGYSKLNDFWISHLDKCGFCGNKYGIDDFYTTICHCGNHASLQLMSKLGINSSYSENGDVKFNCCKDCMPKITKSIQSQDRNLLNHEILINIVKELKS